MIPLQLGGALRLARTKASPVTPSYDRSVETQATLPNVVGEDADGQLELHEPGPRRANDDRPTSRPPAPGQLAWAWLEGAEGIRVGARWIRDSARNEDGTRMRAMPWQQLEVRFRNVCEHRFDRLWSARDRETMRRVELQTWGVVELGDRSVRLPSWLQAPVIDTPLGEVPLSANGKPLRMVVRVMLAWIWLAAEAGTGGVYVSHAQWAEVLGCCRRSVQNHQALLERLGLIRVVETCAPASFGKRGPREGAQKHKNLYRLGPALDCIGLALFERKHVKAPRGSVDRKLAREIATTLRGCARTWGREYQQTDRETRARWAQRSAGASVPALGEAELRDANASSSTAKPSLEAQGDDPPCRAAAQNLPISPPGLSHTGQAPWLGGSAPCASSDGFAVEEDAFASRSSASPSATLPSSSTPARPPIVEQHASCDAVVRVPRQRSTSPASATIEPDRATSRRRAPPCEGAPRKLTMLDRFAAAAQAYGFELDVDAVLEQPPPPSSVSSSTEQQPAAALADDLAGRVVDEHDGVRTRYLGAVERLELGQLRESLDGASLFDSPSSSSSSADAPSSSSRSRRRS